MSMHLVTPAEKDICGLAHSFDPAGQECQKYIVVFAGLGKHERAWRQAEAEVKGHTRKRGEWRAKRRDEGGQAAAHQRYQGCGQVQEDMSSQGSLDWQC